LIVRPQDLDRAAENHDPVVVVVGRREQHLARMNLAALAELEDHGQLLVVELRKSDGVCGLVGHDEDGTGPPAPTSAGHRPRCPAASVRGAGSEIS